MATLYLISTPIGNLSDLSPRAGEALAGVSRVLAEDTRRSGILMRHLELSTPLVSYHAHNEAARISSVLEWLAAGEDLALISDAGTPLVSDPGARLVDAVLEAGHDVVPVPGPSAVLAALVGSGLPADRFTFLGFVPRAGGERTAVLERVAGAGETTVLLESPERLGALLVDLAESCGGDRRVAVARELTKLHEEFFRGTMEEAVAHFGGGAPRGEITVVVEAAPIAAGPDEVDEEAARSMARALLDSGMKPSQAARELARRLGLPRNFCYRIVQSLSDEGE